MPRKDQTGEKPWFKLQLLWTAKDFIPPSKVQIGANEVHWNSCGVLVCGSLILWWELTNQILHPCAASWSISKPDIRLASEPDGDVHPRKKRSFPSHWLWSAQEIQTRIGRCLTPWKIIPSLITTCLLLDWLHNSKFPNFAQNFLVLPKIS